jgi:ATP synthase protein I
MAGPEENKPQKKQSGMVRSIAQAEGMMQLAIALPAGCVIGWFAGSWADKAWHQHWIGIAGVILGAIGGFIQIYRVASGYLKDDGQGK